MRKLFFLSFALYLSIALLGFASLAMADAQVTLAWDPNEPAPDGYLLYQRVEGASYDYTAPATVYAPGESAPIVGPIPQNLTTVEVHGLTPGTTYHFVVRAFVGQDMSGDSNEVEHRPGVAVPAPGNVRVVQPLATFTVTVDPNTGEVVIVAP